MPTSNQASPQALLGFDHKLTHFDGHNITLSRKGVTQPGRWNPPVCTGLVLIHSYRFRGRYQGRRHADTRKWLSRKPVRRVQSDITLGTFPQDAPK